ncbi:MAG: hypothetical protein QW728_03165, partial [Thermoplasmata archaeon]
GGGGGAIWIYADLAYREESGAVFNVSGGKGGRGSVGATNPLNNNGTNGTDGNITKPSAGTPPNPRTSFISAFSYSSTGTYYSSLLDAGRIARWTTAQWIVDTHWTGTSAQLQIRWGNSTDLSSDWSPWYDVSGVKSGGTNLSTETFVLTLDGNMIFGRFLQYRVDLTTTEPHNSSTVYSVSFMYSLPKLIIKNITISPSNTPSVTLYNNDTFTLNYNQLYLNSSENSYSFVPPTLSSGESYTINLPSGFFKSVDASGDYLFLNDSTSTILGSSPNGIIDFVNWTDVSGNPPPGCGDVAATNSEWYDGPVDLSALSFNPSQDSGINRTTTLVGMFILPNDNDIRGDWMVVPEFPLHLAALPVLTIAIISIRRVAGGKMKTRL